MNRAQGRTKLTDNNLLVEDNNAASARQPTLISGNLEDSDEEEDEDGNRKMKPKHIRWQLEEGKDETSGANSFLIAVSQFHSQAELLCQVLSY